MLSVDSGRRYAAVDGPWRTAYGSSPFRLSMLSSTGAFVVLVDLGLLVFLGLGVSRYVWFR